MKHCRLSANEILWATAWALLAFFLTSLPYLLGCYLSSPEMHYDFPVCSGWITNPAAGLPGLQSGGSGGYSFTG